MIPPQQPALPFDTDLAKLAAARPGAFTPKPLCASVQGFSLHAATTVHEDDRAGLERLCRYGLRAPFSMRRFSQLPDGRVRYELRRPWPTEGGTSELVLDPLDLMRRLAAIMPAPYSNMVRYHGVFASRSKYKSRLPPPGGSEHTAELELAGHSNDDDAATTPGVDSTGEAGQSADNQSDDQPDNQPDDQTTPRRFNWATLLKRALDVDALSCPQ